MLDGLAHDLRFGLRLLRRRPAFTLAALLALTLGIGATTAVFTLLDRVVLRPLPYPEPDRLAMVWETNTAKGLPHEALSPVNFLDYRGLSHVFSDAAAWWYPQVNLTEPGHEPLRVPAVETSANLFSVVGAQPALGAGFPPGPLYARELVAVISHRLWRERFGADPAIVGKTITLNDEAFTVVGVMPAGFDYPKGTDVWERLNWDMGQHSRAAHFMEAVFRLGPGVSLDRADAELRALTARLAAEHAATNGGWSARAVPLAHEVVGYFRPALVALFGASALLLLIACTNVASLLLARATVREREVAVRAAIGAGRGRLVRQFLTESLILAVAGTLLGTVVGLAAVRALVAVSPVPVPRFTGVSLDGAVLAFAAAIAGLTAVGFGVVPAVFMARGDIQRPLKEAGRGVDGTGARRRARSLLVSAEIALAVMLLVGAALVGRSFMRLVGEDPGFRPSHVTTVSFDLPVLGTRTSGRSRTSTRRRSRRSDPGRGWTMRAAPTSCRSIRGGAWRTRWADGRCRRPPTCPRRSSNPLTRTTSTASACRSWRAVSSPHATRSTRPASCSSIRPWREASGRGPIRSARQSAPPSA